MIYLYKCAMGHITEHVFKMGEHPETVTCLYDDYNNPVYTDDGGKTFRYNAVEFCGQTAKRHFSTMPSVHYNGTGFASTDIPRRSGLEDIKI